MSNRVITAHELAKILLDGPDVEVAVLDSYEEPENTGLTTGYINMQSLKDGDSVPHNVVGDAWIIFGGW